MLGKKNGRNIMNKLTKAGIIASIVGKIAYGITSVMYLTKSFGKKVKNRVYYRSKWTVEISSLDSGEVLIENLAITLAEIIEKAKVLEDANVRIVMERRQ